MSSISQLSARIRPGSNHETALLEGSILFADLIPPTKTPTIGQQPIMSQMNGRTQAYSPKGARQNRRDAQDKRRNQLRDILVQHLTKGPLAIGSAIKAAEAAQDTIWQEKNLKAALQIKN